MKKIWMALILVAVFLIIGVNAEEQLLQPIDYSLPVIKAILAHQKARLNGNYKAMWETLTRQTQKQFRDFKNFDSIFSAPERKKRDPFYGKAKLVGMKFITDKRVWVSLNDPMVFIPGVYFIQEDGEWKYASINKYFNQAKADLDYIGKLIKNYYQDNKKLPDTLLDLKTSIPLDLFNDNNEAYVYKVIDGTKCMLYSFGPNSKDDNGTVVDWSTKSITPLINGDIVWSFISNNG